jgi:hypothetical protein
MSLFSKILLISLTVIGNSNCFLLQSYKLTKPPKLSRSNTPLYLSIKNKNSSNFLKLNDDDGSSYNNNNKLFNWSDYNYKLQQFLNLSLSENTNATIQDNDHYDDFYYKPVYLFGLSEYDLILFKIVIITLINAYLIALIVDYSLYQLLLIH